MLRLLAILLVIVGVFWAVRRLLAGVGSTSTETQRTPLVMEPDEPLMLEAISAARGSLDEFRRLMAADNRGARVKVPFRTDTGADEQLWADVLAVVDPDVEVHLTTDPVSQRGSFAKVRRYALTDLLDWQVELPDGRYAGGYTMRAMFRKGREQWGTLPGTLEAEERRYR